MRYADDCIILVRSRRATERVRDSIANFAEKKLFLKVNKEKTVMGALSGIKFLDYTYYWRTDRRCGLALHPQSREKFKRRLKQITCRSNGKGYTWLKDRLAWYIRGWICYFSLADINTFVIETNGWYQRRLQMYIWKSWKRVRTRFNNLQKCGVSECLAWQWVNNCKSYWRISDSAALNRAISNQKLVLAGYTHQ